jgi:hypothetical protein
VARKQQAGGEMFHVSDARVWAEINYLDSPTDYREYLLAAGLRGSTLTNDPRLRSDDSCRPPQVTRWFLFLLSGLFVLVLVLLHLLGS